LPRLRLLYVGSCESQFGQISRRFPVDCWWGPHRCGPTPMREAGPATRWLRHRSRSSPTEPRRGTGECSDGCECRSTPRRIRANVSYWYCAGPTPDMHCRSRPSDCVSKVESRNRDIASRYEATTRHRQLPCQTLEPPIGIEPMTFRLQGERSTTELRRPAGTEFIGSLVGVDDALRRHRPR
jgi:hypothetical protein